MKKTKDNFLNMQSSNAFTCLLFKPAHVDVYFFVV